jgi:ABC-2 type transport system ATP-binding protein
VDVIEVRGLTKTYRRRRRPALRALDGLDLTVGSGGVHGFLGPNGSGKTTTIRALLGLVRADEGELRLFGRPVPKELPAVIGQVGALVETPLFFPTFAGRLNLQLLAETAGVSRGRVEECLELVDLRDRAGERFKGYSLGMKQRLGIAAALLKQPRLLVLDEPSNGLDPAGIRDVRELVRRLGADGHTTVFLSSHLLAEVEQVCDSVSIMARGRCVASGPVSDVLAGRSSGDVRVRVDDLAAGRAVLERAGHRVSDDDGALLVAGVQAPADLTRLLAGSGHWVSELTPVAVDLEEAFLALTADAVPEARP